MKLYGICIFIGKKFGSFRKMCYFCRDLTLVHVRLSKVYGHLKTGKRGGTYMVSPRFFLDNYEDSNNNRRTN